MRRLHDLVGVGGRLGLLDLRDHRDVALVGGQPLPHRLEVVGPADERQGHQVDPHLDARVDHRQVRLAHRGEGHRDIREVQSLAGGDRPSHLDLHLDVAVPDLAHPQPDRPVRQVDDVVLGHQLGEPGPGDRKPRGVALNLLGREDDPRLGLELDQVAGHGPQPELRPRDVLQHRDLAVGGGRRSAHASHRLGVLLGGAVGEVQARHVHPGPHHGLQHVGLARGRSDRRHDLGGPHRGCIHLCGDLEVAACGRPRVPERGRPSLSIFGQGKAPTKRPLLADRPLGRALTAGGKSA